MAKADAEGERLFAPMLRLYVEGNPLNETTRESQLPQLAQFGVRVNR
jgi:hypothetical protein